MAISVSFVSERLSLHIHKGGVSAALLELSGLLSWAGLVCVWEASQWVALGTFFFPQLKNSDCTEFTHCKRC